MCSSFSPEVSLAPHEKHLRDAIWRTAQQIAEAQTAWMFHPATAFHYRDDLIVQTESGVYVLDSTGTAPLAQG